MTRPRPRPKTGVQPLPRSLDPLAGESLVGYLLRLAHRLDLSPARVAVLTGLADAHLPSIPAGRLLALTPDHAAAFARATHLSTAEVTALTLISFADRYPPVNPAFSGRQRQNHGIFVKENWVFSRASRYCPDCLAGDGSRSKTSTAGPGNSPGGCPSCSPVRFTDACSAIPAQAATSPPTIAPPARSNC
ncbi:TniQ family protein [Amycolatopsis sulphurea]|uniref:TniQ family protein n=1 Tax=Amycolatopsis sulphurea TaxID=76022 RepID=UPI0014740203|nr:TniQ family protein [Amycolatopsis sulphurea]